MRTETTEDVHGKVADALLSMIEWLRSSECAFPDNLIQELSEVVVPYVWNKLRRDCRCHIRERVQPVYEEWERGEGFD